MWKDLTEPAYPGGHFKLLFSFPPALGVSLSPSWLPIGSGAWKEERVGQPHRWAGGKVSVVTGEEEEEDEPSGSGLVR